MILSATVIEDQAKLLKIGADAYLAKGRLEELKANILAILKRLEAKEAGRPGEAILGAEKAHPRTLVKELLQLKRHHEALLRNMREGVLNIDQEEKVTYVNPAGLEILGRLEREVIGRPVLQLFEAEDRGRIGRILDGFRLGEGKGGASPSLTRTGPCSSISSRHGRRSGSPASASSSKTSPLWPGRSRSCKPSTRS